MKKLSNIEKIAKIWQLQLNLEYENQDRNVRLSFKDIGAFCEFLAIDYNPDFVGSGSGGMGLDLSNFITRKAIECKSCCTIQNSRCGDCGGKFNSLFLDRCPHCNSSKYEIIEDSRFSINAKELLDEIRENIFENLTLCHIYLSDIQPQNNLMIIKLRWFRVDFNNTEVINYQLEYFKNQVEKGKSNTCNLLPYSFDFYKLRPLQFAETTIKINYADINVVPLVSSDNNCFYPRVPEKIIPKDKLSDFRKLSSYKNDSADSMDFTKNISYKQKSLGKERGDTRKNVYGRLTGGLK